MGRGRVYNEVRAYGREASASTDTVGCTAGELAAGTPEEAAAVGEVEETNAGVGRVA
jgi:hypothetical protein